MRDVPLGLLVFVLIFPVLWIMFPGATMLGDFVAAKLGIPMIDSWITPPGKIPSWMLGQACIWSWYIIPFLGRWGRHQMEKWH